MALFYAPCAVWRAPRPPRPRGAPALDECQRECAFGAQQNRGPWGVPRLSDLKPKEDVWAGVIYYDARWRYCKHHQEPCPARRPFSCPRWVSSPSRSNRGAVAVGGGRASDKPQRSVHITKGVFSRCQLGTLVLSRPRPAPSGGGGLGSGGGGGGAHLPRGPRRRRPGRPPSTGGKGGRGGPARSGAGRGRSGPGPELESCRPPTLTSGGWPEVSLWSVERRWWWSVW